MNATYEPKNMWVVRAYTRKHPRTSRHRLGMVRVRAETKAAAIETILDANMERIDLCGYRSLSEAGMTAGTHMTASVR